MKDIIQGGLGDIEDGRSGALSIETHDAYLQRTTHRTPHTTTQRNTTHHTHTHTHKIFVLNMGVHILSWHNF